MLHLFVIARTSNEKGFAIRYGRPLTWRPDYAPLVLHKPNYYELLSSHDVKNKPAFLEALDGSEGTYDERAALERALGP